MANALTLAKLDHRLRGAAERCLPARTFVAGYSRFRSNFIHSLAKAKVGPVDGHTAPVSLWGLTFRNDLGNAAGLDKDGGLLDFQYDLGAGFAVVGTVLARPHTGNLSTFLGVEANPWTPLPASHAALNSLGLPSKGVGVAVDAIRDFKKRRQPKDFPVGVSMMGHPLDEGDGKLQGVLDCMRQALPVADFIEINESCPNVGGLDVDGLASRLKAIAKVRDEVSPKTPVLVKLANFGNVAATLKLLAEVGLQGAVGVNTQKNYDELRPTLAKVDQSVFDYYVKQYGGGLSGKPIAGFARDQIVAAHAVIEQEQLPLELVHVGGIASSDDVRQSRPHAKLREWYTGFMEALAAMPPEDVYPSMTR